MYSGNEFRNSGGIMAIQAMRDDSANSLVDVIERVLDKGVIINADICVSVAGVELLGIKIRAAVASFETAAKYGLEFPSGTNLNTAVWDRIKEDTETCPQCGKKVPVHVLLNENCPWCGWSGIKALNSEHGIKRVSTSRR
jgi:ssDNA-binding Zn-finger/Zn-ribbon topoisomerase 1